MGFLPEFWLIIDSHLHSRFGAYILLIIYEMDKIKIMGLQTPLPKSLTTLNTQTNSQTTPHVQQKMRNRCKNNYIEGFGALNWVKSAVLGNLGGAGWRKRVYSLPSNTFSNSFSHRNVYQDDVNTFSKMVKHFCPKA